MSAKAVSIHRDLVSVPQFIEEVTAKCTPGIETVAVAVKDAKGSWFTFYQRARPSDLTMAALLLNEEALKLAKQNAEQG